MSEELRSRLLASYMSVYPAKDSTTEAIEYIENNLPESKADIFALLMVYHNTLINELLMELAVAETYPSGYAPLH